jgi:hypothetical protein
MSSGSSVRQSLFFRRKPVDAFVSETRPSFSPLFSESRGETVWKIAKGVSAVLLAAKEMADRDSFDPSWPLSEPSFGTYPEFPNSFGKRLILGSSR